MSVMELTWALSAGGLGMILGFALAHRFGRRTRLLTPGPIAPADHDVEPPLAGPVGELLAVLRSAAVVVDSADAVVQVSPAALALGLVRDRDLAHHELVEVIRLARRDGQIREDELELPRGPMGAGRLFLGVRVAPLGAGQVLLLVEDRTQAKRVEDVRRDFVANVSHELKTPVGGISLLAEAVLDAKDDPAAVDRFARRISVESTRLTRLIQEIVDLSRLQAAESLNTPTLVRVADVVHEAADQVATVAEATQKSLVISADEAALVYGDADLLVTAVNNLLTNAINYSGSGTRVALGVRTADEVVEITVSDQGRGIPRSEQERIFERFYRVDPARSRATGGTGLGLAIVKHIVTNHGGEVRVWSELGQGSTFTLRLPAAHSSSVAHPPAPPTPAAPPTRATQPISAPHPRGATYPTSREATP